MPERRRIPNIINGKSKLEGYNVGPYPLHKFLYISDPEDFYPLLARGCGIDEWRRGCYRRRKFSDTFAIEYVQEGVFIFQQDNITVRAEPGDVFLVHLDKDNSMKCETEFAFKKTIIMKGTMLRQILDNLGLSQCNMISSEEHVRLAHYFDQIYELNKHDTYENRRLSSTLCYSLLVELAELATIRQRPAELQRALEFIQTNLTAKISLVDMVRYSGISRATLHRQFRKFMNMSPVEYYLDQKLARAKSLFENNLYSVKEVSDMLNYASPQYFAAEFKKKFGHPPKYFKCRRG